MTIDINACKESFSNAYLQAVVSTARMTMTKPAIDVDSIDWSITRPGGPGKYRSPQIDVQLKCTSRNIFTEETINFPLRVKNYNELRGEDICVPRILIVIAVPEISDHWLDQSEEQLLMRHCAYWYSLRHMPETKNTASVMISIPRKQMLTPLTLQEMMKLIADGGAP